MFEQLALALKNRVALKFFTGLKYFLSFRNFEQLALALKTEYALKSFKPRGGSPPCPPPRTPMGLRHRAVVPKVRPTKGSHPARELPRTVLYFDNFL